MAFPCDACYCRPSSATNFQPQWSDRQNQGNKVGGSLTAPREPLFGRPPTAAALAPPAAERSPLQRLLESVCSTGCKVLLALLRPIRSDPIPSDPCARRARRGVCAKGATNEHTPQAETLKHAKRRKDAAKKPKQKVKNRLGGTEIKHARGIDGTDTIVREKAAGFS